MYSRCSVVTPRMHWGHVENVLPTVQRSPDAGHISTSHALTDQREPATGHRGQASSPRVAVRPWTLVHGLL